MSITSYTFNFDKDASIAETKSYDKDASVVGSKSYDKDASIDSVIKSYKTLSYTVDGVTDSGGSAEFTISGSPGIDVNENFEVGSILNVQGTTNYNGLQKITVITDDTTIETDRSFVSIESPGSASMELVDIEKSYDKDQSIAGTKSFDKDASIAGSEAYSSAASVAGTKSFDKDTSINGSKSYDKDLNVLGTKSYDKDTDLGDYEAIKTSTLTSTASFTLSSGNLRMTIPPDVLYLTKGQRFVVSGTTNYDGIHEIDAVISTGEEFDLVASYIANDSGNISVVVEDFSYDKDQSVAGTKSFDKDESIAASQSKTTWSGSRSGVDFTLVSGNLRMTVPVPAIGLVVGQKVYVRGTTNYDGEQEISAVISSVDYELTASHVSDEFSATIYSTPEEKEMDV